MRLGLSPTRKKSGGREQLVEQSGGNEGRRRLGKTALGCRENGRTRSKGGGRISDIRRENKEGKLDNRRIEMTKDARDVFFLFVGKLCNHLRGNVSRAIYEALLEKNSTKKDAKFDLLQKWMPRSKCETEMHKILSLSYNGDSAKSGPQIIIKPFSKPMTKGLLCLRYSLPIKRITNPGVLNWK